MKNVLKCDTPYFHNYKVLLKASKSGKHTLQCQNSLKDYSDKEPNGKFKIEIIENKIH